MPKKNTPRNGFYFFMKDVKDEEEAQGRRYDMAQIQSIAGPRWQEMSAEDKAYYQQLAKSSKARDKDDREHKYTSLGTSIAQVDAQERERFEREQLMLNTIHNDCNIPVEALINKLFYLCHVNYSYYKPCADDAPFYAPCEIGLVEFSLKHGITNSMNLIVNAGPLPLGFRAESEEWARDTHLIYPHHKTGFEVEKEVDMRNVYTSVTHFFKKERDNVGRYVLPPVYTMGDSLNHHHSISAVESCMTFLCKCTNQPRTLFRVFKLSNLFQKLMEKLDPKGGIGFTLAVLEAQILQDPFCYSSDIACKYHEEKDRVQFCSLSMIKRWVFTICDFICVKANIEMIPGQHLPREAAVGWRDDECKKEPELERNSWNEDATAWTQHKMKDLNLRESEDERGRRGCDYESVDSESNFDQSSLASDNDNFPELWKTAGKRKNVPKNALPIWPIAGRGRGRPI